MYLKWFRKTGKWLLELEPIAYHKAGVALFSDSRN
jgi:hypothetical protein